MHRKVSAMRTQAIGVCLIGMMLMWVPVPEPSEPPPRDDKIATFSIAAVDRETGVCGAAVASKFPAVGKVVAHARADIGAFCTQHYGVKDWGPKALDLLGDGK